MDGGISGLIEVVKVFSNESRLRRTFQAELSIIHFKGWGFSARIELSKGNFIGLYLDERISIEEFLQRGRYSSWHVSQI